MSLKHLCVKGMVPCLPCYLEVVGAWGEASREEARSLKAYPRMLYGDPSPFSFSLCSPAAMRWAAWLQQIFSPVNLCLARDTKLWTQKLWSELSETRDLQTFLFFTLFISGIMRWCWKANAVFRTGTLYILCLIVILVEMLIDVHPMVNTVGLYVWKGRYICFRPCLSCAYFNVTGLQPYSGKRREEAWVGSREFS